MLVARQGPLVMPRLRIAQHRATIAVEKPRRGVWQISHTAVETLAGRLYAEREFRSSVGAYSYTRVLVSVPFCSLVLWFLWLSVLGMSVASNTITLGRPVRSFAPTIRDQEHASPDEHTDPDRTGLGDTGPSTSAPKFLRITHHTNRALPDQPALGSFHTGKERVGRFNP
jgi:hypothetical protein